MRAQYNVDRLSLFSIMINAVQIIAVLAIAGMVVIGNHLESATPRMIEIVVAVAAGLIIWGAVVDILQAYNSRRMQKQAEMLQEAYRQLESLNVTLRAQRHDFMNHLQVVYSLIEMSEQKEAADYIEKVYGDIQAVSRTMRTASPAVNALLKVKLAECERRGIEVDMQINAAWKDLPIQGWEMCRVLGNLIDNAMDALGETGKRVLTLVVSEDLRSYRFRVENNGVPIPLELRERIFQSGFSTKRTGQGMGLHIVQEILRENGGDILLTSDDTHTVFEGWLPRTNPIRDEDTAKSATNVKKMS